jgi:acetolactate synthase-1/2/3 large subunit
MWIDHHALFKPITKATLRLRRGEIAATLAEALRIAMSEPQGPVHLDLPEDVALAPSSEALPSLLAPIALQPASEVAIARAASVLGAAKRPVAVIGASAMRMKHPEALLSFVERHRMPFASTTMAKGLIDEDHPLALGCIERAKRQTQRAFLRGADLIIGLGYDTVEVEYEAWAGDVPVLHVNIERADVDASVNMACEVVGDLDASLARLAALPSTHNDITVEAVRLQREAFQRALRPHTSNFCPYQAIDVVRRILPRHGVLTFDTGAHTHQIGSQWKAHSPRTFLINNGWSSMGFGMPAAIAAKIARPDLPVVCVLGDGCFQMTCGELAVAARLSLAIPFIVLDDRWLSLIRVKQERRHYEYYGTDVVPSDYDQPPAHYFGVPAVGVRSADDLGRALTKALSASGPVVIEAVVDAAHYSETVFD